MFTFPITQLDIFLSKLYYTHIHVCLPSPLKNITSNIFHIIKLKFLVRLRNLKTPIYIVTGKKKNNHVTSKILYIGDNSSLEYLNEIIFSGETKKQFIDEILIWSFQKKIKKLSPSVDAIFIKTDRFFSNFLEKKGFIVVPEWIEMVMEKNLSSDVFLNRVKKSARDDIRKVRNYKYTYEISTDIKDFENFYHDIYLPFIIQRQKKKIIPEAVDYHEIRSIFERGQLLLVKKQDEIISGSIIHTFGKTAFFTYAGVKTKPDYLKKAAGSALYYFFIRWAMKQGFDTLKFGGARAFLKDGLFQYKRKWGLKCKVSNDMFGVFAFKACENKTQWVNDFIEKNPVICFEKN
ncbi:MAG: hypothetical protein DRN24_06345, partial [Thermoplasmata archaeon]